MGLIHIWTEVKSLAERLNEIGVEDPQVEAEVFLSYLLNVPRPQLAVPDTFDVSEEQLEQIVDFVAKRKKQIPIQHVLGSWNFYGLEMSVNKHVLIPRPETEGLVQIISDWLQTQSKKDRIFGVDWGTGSGCISVTLSHLHQNVWLQALDISEKALMIARANAMTHGVVDRVQFIRSDGMQNMERNQSIDFIVSNPPYIETGEILTLAPEVKDNDPMLALDGGESGLDCYRKIVSEIQQLSDWPRFMAFEIGSNQAQEVSQLFKSLPQYEVEIQQDLLGRDRYLVAQLL